MMQIVFVANATMSSQCVESGNVVVAGSGSRTSSSAITKYIGGKQQRQVVPTNVATLVFGSSRHLRQQLRLAIFLVSRPV